MEIYITHEGNVLQGKWPAINVPKLDILQKCATQASPIAIVSTVHSMSINNSPTLSSIYSAATESGFKVSTNLFMQVHKLKALIDSRSTDRSFISHKVTKGLKLKQYLSSGLIYMTADHRNCRILCCGPQPSWMWVHKCSFKCNQWFVHWYNPWNWFARAANPLQPNFKTRPSLLWFRNTTCTERKNHWSKPIRT